MKDRVNILQWEYNKVYGMGVEQLDEYGKEGWELISVVSDGEEDYIYFFKKPVWSSNV